MTIPKSPVPFSNYGMLSGQLFLYAGGRAAFESPVPSMSEQGSPTRNAFCWVASAMAYFRFLILNYLPIPVMKLLGPWCNLSFRALILGLDMGASNEIVEKLRS
eukprot:CAMPEP_0176001518 /NCGR_PEP_ID=MMETSP0120_2-20121206/167_1 /TAXON_ID=160619 /ORGANISM="Kryptoperidinium foliaceum, Strain CCMP 1326" /LENGTH=103 /DNA_ID=CAMNT_0017334067 /DNA_START=84 /DNA_END=395 /DNA_ORIENTATION=-